LAIKKQKGFVNEKCNKIFFLLSIVGLTGCSIIFEPDSKPPQPGQVGDGWKAPCGQSLDNPCSNGSNQHNGSD